MTQPGTIKERFPATAADVRHALIRTDAALDAGGAAELLRIRAEIALGEIFNNIVEHAYDGAEAVHQRDILICLTLQASGIDCDVRDWGKPMPDGGLSAKPYPPIDAGDVPGLPEGGFGWALVRDLADDLCYRREDGQNILQFHLSQPD